MCRYFWKGSVSHFSHSIMSTLCDPMDCSMPGFPVPHHLPKFAHIHIHCIDDTIQPSHPLTALFSFGPQSFPANGTFPISQLLISDDQNTAASASASVLPMSIHGWFPLRLTGLISSLSKKLSEVFFSITVWRHQFFGVLPYLRFNSHSLMWPLGRKTIALTIWTFVGRVMSLLFNILSRFVIVFLPRSNRLLISWLQSPSAVILESKKRKSVTTSAVSPSICHAVTGLEARILIFINI